MMKGLSRCCRVARTLLDVAVGGNVDAAAFSGLDADAIFASLFVL